jgi:hypothetical protein
MDTVGNLGARAMNPSSYRDGVIWMLLFHMLKPLFSESWSVPQTAMKP